MSLSIETIREHLDGLAKPKGSLGKWEHLSERLCWIQQTVAPEVRPAELIVFGADHGVASEGVTLWPSSITTVMLEQIAIGGSVSAVLADSYGMDRRVIDVGTKTPPRIEVPQLTSRRVRAGTDNFEHGPAMTLSEFRECLQIGADEARMSQLRGAKVVVLGDMGIGNTTSASCLARLLADVPMEQCVGSGAGSNEQSLARKLAVVEQATDRVLQRCGYEIDEAGIAEVSGFEIIAMAGFMAQAAKNRQVVVLDGMIATAAALIAEKLAPDTVDALIASHLSEEPAHKEMLARLRLEPYLDWNMRLGEGTGALAIYPLLLGAAAWTRRTIKISDLILP